MDDPDQPSSAGEAQTTTASTVAPDDAGTTPDAPPVGSSTALIVFIIAVSSALFFLCMEDIRPELRANRYWGHTSHSALGTGDSTGWPFHMSLRVNETENIKKGWKPGDRR